MDEHLEDTRDAPAVPNALLQQHEECLLLAADYHMAAAGAVSFNLARRSRHQHVRLRLHLRINGQRRRAGDELTPAPFPRLPKCAVAG